MVDIGRRMVKVLRLLREGCHGIGAPEADMECDDLWCRDYAIVANIVPDEVFESHYFDHERWRGDMVDLVMKTIMEGNDEVVMYRHRDEEIKITDAVPKKRVFRIWVKPGTIVVNFTRADEIEVYRAKLPEKKTASKVKTLLEKRGRHGK